MPQSFSLVPHPDFPARAVRSMSVEVEVAAPGFLRLTYHVVGEIDAVLWPALGPGGRGDRLWEHSCFEAFVGRPGEVGYSELNLATSGQWAAYDFGGYRAGMRSIENISVALSCSAQAERLDFSAAAHLPILSSGREWQLGLSAIIEARDGSKSYWALSHAPGAPDFHNRDCFRARLAAPSAA